MISDDEILRLSKDGVDELKAAIADFGGEMSQHQFDKVFADWSARPFPRWIVRGGILWGDMAGSVWSCWLDLLQFMASAGIAIIEKRDDVIYYRLSEAGKEAPPVEETER